MEENKEKSDENSSFDDLLNKPVPKDVVPGTTEKESGEPKDMEDSKMSEKSELSIKGEW